MATFVYNNVHCLVVQIGSCLSPSRRHSLSVRNISDIRLPQVIPLTVFIVNSSMLAFRMNLSAMHIMTV